MSGWNAYIGVFGITLVESIQYTASSRTPHILGGICSRVRAIVPKKLKSREYMVGKVVGHRKEIERLIFIYTGNGSKRGRIYQNRWLWYIGRCKCFYIKGFPWRGRERTRREADLSLYPMLGPNEELLDKKVK